MPTLFERDVEALLVLTAMLEGCSYYGCKDDLKRDYVPKAEPEWRDARWQDAQTLDVYFGAALSPPTEVDPRRFALLRYNVKIDNNSDYYCHFDLCYRELDQIEGIPESLDWDPAEPSRLRLHFAEPIPPASCEPWRGNRADFQALELIYLGVEPISGTDTGDPGGEPDQLAYADEEAVEAIGPDRVRQWLEGCFAGGSCELGELCIDRGGYSDFDRDERALRIDCP